MTELVVLGDALLRRSRPVSRIDFLTLAQGEVPAGTRGLRRLRAALPLIRARTDSCQETRLRLLLRDAGLPEPEVNRPILDRQRILAIPDLSYPDARLAIEYDGDIHRTDRRTWTRDLARRRTLEAHNWLIHTWTAADLRDPTRALGHLRRQLSRR
ncbi:hypothetical protein [Cellulomonas sp. NPDC089187]|uniref:hypothetical protein n=1 Tax=Cellulomonas sp. NPDC089187 TaxID=3154970 RepID=UPI003431657C